VSAAVTIAFCLLLPVFTGIIVYFATKKKFDSRIKDLILAKEQLQSLIDLERSKVKMPVPEVEKAEEKNKKLWQMSEAVYREKKKVDEENELLITEKEKLSAEKKKLDDKVKKLWQTSTAIHKEKERINELKLEIEHKHQEILDSVNYAKRIQRALLANNKLLEKNLPEFFVMYQPKDIVSGDFYWADHLNNGSFSLVAADSTGHGVPGAIMSILNISCLSEAINAQKLSLPNEILDYSRHRIMEHMANDGSLEGGKDGMDAVICNFNFKDNLLQFAAANNPLWLIRDNELIEYKPDKMPVGKPMGEIKPFTLQQISLKKNDLIIMLTDGFADQFGGPNGKKFMYKPLKELILNINNAPLSDIKNELKRVFSDWKANSEQVDDVLIIGVRI
jgi:serine phosphatase RsbU (regulator of sigma subunit)